MLKKIAIRAMKTELCHVLKIVQIEYIIYELNINWCNAIIVKRCLLIYPLNAVI
jgi:hypothetical protein